MARAFSLFFCWLRPSWHRTILPGRDMKDLHRGIRRVYSLAAGSASAAHFDPNIFGPDFDIDFFGFRKNSHCRGRGVDPALALQLTGHAARDEHHFRIAKPERRTARSL